MKTGSTNKKIRDIIRMLGNGSLIPRPEFQRNLIWTRDDKKRFIETINMGYPFPEIYLADGTIDTASAEGTQLLVDGQQRITTIYEYFHGALVPYGITAYADLTEDEKSNFLQYEIAVRDLGSISRESIIEVFRRINATKYSLNDMEINNAVYSGKLKTFCESLVESDFIEKNKVFSPADSRRMNDVKIMLSIVCTFLGGYFHRDDSFEKYLSLYNDEFPDADDIKARIVAVFDLIDECGFQMKSSIWKKANFFSLICEIDNLLHIYNLPIDPSDIYSRMTKLLEKSENQSGTIPIIYNRAALQASNDKSNRIIRGKIIQGTLQGRSASEIKKMLKDEPTLI